MKTHMIQTSPILFSVFEQNGIPVQYLELKPICLTDYEDSNWQTNYVLIEIRLFIAGDVRVVGDYFTIGCRTDFASIESIQESQTEIELLSVQHNFGLTASWCSETQDIQFVGRIPAFEFSDQDRFELHKENSILSTISFEFVLSPIRIETAVHQLNELLDVMDIWRPPYYS